MRRWIPAVVLIFVAHTAAAGLEIEYDARRTGLAPYRFSGRATIHDGHTRYDTTAGYHPMFNPNITVISIRSGETLTVLDHKLKTYFFRKGDFMSGPIGTWKGPGELTAMRPFVRVTKVDGAQETIAGHRTQRYDIEVSYALRMKLEGEKMQAQVRAIGSFWLADIRTPAVPHGLQFALKAGFPHVDDKIERALRLRGLPLRQAIEVTRTIEGGNPISEGFNLEVTRLTELVVSDSKFRPPSEYQFREPTFGYSGSD